MKDEPIKILLVEDNLLDAKFFRECLSLHHGMDAEVRHVSRISEAERKLAGERFDLVAVDLGLPDAEGLEAYHRIHRLFAGTPVVVLTGKDDAEDGALAVKAGAQDYLVKDRTDPERLVQAIRYAIGRDRHLGQLRRLGQRLRGANRALKRLSVVDPLTGLYNRRGFEPLLASKARAALVSGRHPVAMAVDVDDFKRVNDLLGHDAGDRILRGIAGVLRRCLPKPALLARVGGDEFLALFPDRGREASLKVAEKVREGIAGNTEDARAHPMPVSASIGMVHLDPGRASIEDLLAMTHHSLYKSKKQGKNRVSFDWKAGVGGPSWPSVADVVETLRQGARLRVVRQSIRRLSDQSVAAYEYLSRLDMPEYQSPVDFFHIASNAGILSIVDRCCFQACLARAAEEPAGTEFHVNLFPSTMQSLSPREAMEALSGLEDRRRLVVEINEQDAGVEISRLTQAVRGLKRAGVRIALDDVGSGAGYLDRLVVLEPDLLKIDRKAVAGISRLPARQKVMERLLKVARSLEAQVVAEGIESEEDARVLRDMGVSYGQGFYWEKPF